MLFLYATCADSGVLLWANSGKFATSGAQTHLETTPGTILPCCMWVFFLKIIEFDLYACCSSPFPDSDKLFRVKLVESDVDSTFPSPELVVGELLNLFGTIS